MPAASINAVAPFCIVSFVSAPPAASACMMSGSRNLAASKYGVDPINVAGRLKSVVSRRIGVPLVMRMFGLAPCASNALTRFTSLLRIAACSAE